MIWYREWNYDTGIVTAYARSGACKQCGACCIAHISFGYTEPPRAGDSRKGGNTTSGEGVWQEIDKGRWSYFYQITVAPEESICGGYSDDGLCCQHEDPYRSMLCQVWPIGPTCIAQFPECGWSFEETGHWEIDSL